MSAYSTNANVQTGITDYTRGRVLPGQRPNNATYIERNVSGVDSTVNVAQVTTIEITASANLDTPAIVIGEATFPFVSSTTDNLTAAAGGAALTDAIDEGDLLALIVESIDVTDSTITVTFSNYVAHEVSFTAEGSTTATVTDTADAVAQVNHKGGVFLSVVDSADPTMTSVHLPADAAEAIHGCLFAGPYSNHTTPANPYGLTGDESWPAGVPMEFATNGDFCARLGANVSKGDPVYVIMDPTNAYNGHATNALTTKNAAAQVTRGDVEYNGTDAVGVTVDGYTVQVPSNTSDDQTATDLKAAWDADDYALTKATASINLSGDESYFILTFLDNEPHVVVAYSPATADITSITNTTAASAGTVTSKRYKSAVFTESRTLAEGSANLDLG